MKLPGICFDLARVDINIGGEINVRYIFPDCDIPRNLMFQFINFKESAATRSASKLDKKTIKHCFGRAIKKTVMVSFKSVDIQEKEGVITYNFIGAIWTMGINKET